MIFENYQTIMTEKQALSQHYQELINQLSSFENSPSSSLENLQAYFSQIHARLNPDASLNPKVNCPGCHISRTEKNHINDQESPIKKAQNRRMKQIQKIRRIKKRTKKQENLLKKLLMWKNGFQVKVSRLIIQYLS